MASVIRVKRRIDADPVEALFLSCKRRREADLIETKSVLSFVGTIRSKDEPVSRHIKDAIRRKKIHKDLHPHSTNFHAPEITGKTRQATTDSSRANRYRITWSRRALDINLLDEDDLDDAKTGGDDLTGKPVSSSRVDGMNDQPTANNTESSSENKENVPSGVDPCDRIKTLTPKELLNGKSMSKVENPDRCKSVDDAKDHVMEDKMFCMFDVETDEQDDIHGGFNQQSASGITLNNIPMQSKKVDPVPSSEFVYDLYYTHNNLGDLDQEAVLTVEALCNELVCEPEDERQDRDAVYDDEDDSNDENNWRADYPDEDPRFFENADEDYDYAEDMVDTDFLRDDDNDGGDLLAYWMNTRCNVGPASDDGEDEYEAEDGDDSESSD